MTTLPAAEARKLLAKPKRSRPEQALQIAVAQFLARALRPPVWWSSIDHGAGKMTPASAGLRKARGVKPGIPDILIFAPAGHYETKVIGIELKADKGSLTETQKDVIGDWMKTNAVVRIARSVDDVIHILRVEIPLWARLS